MVAALRRHDNSRELLGDGLGGGHHAWDRQLPFFAARGYAAHAWDQPGYAEGHVTGERRAQVAVRDLLAPIRPLLDRQ